MRHADRRRGAGLSRVWRHDRAHRFFSHARWSAEAFGLVLARQEIGCDLGCDYVAVNEHIDGWATPTIEGGRETIPPYLICSTCKASWEQGD